MKIKYGVLLLAISLIPWNADSSAPTAGSTDAEVRRLLSANGSGDVGQAVGLAIAKQFIAGLRRTNPSLPARADMLVTDFVVAYVRRAADQDQFVEKLIPIYENKFTSEDVGRLAEFYRSPLGRKLVSVTPSISLESAEVGQQWIESILPQLQTELLSQLRAEKLLE